MPADFPDFPDFHCSSLRCRDCRGIRGSTEFAVAHRDSAFVIFTADFPGKTHQRIAALRSGLLKRVSHFRDYDAGSNIGLECAANTVGLSLAMQREACSRLKKRSRGMQVCGSRSPVPFSSTYYPASSRSRLCTGLPVYLARSFLPLPLRLSPLSFFPSVCLSRGVSPRPSSADGHNTWRR